MVAFADNALFQAGLKYENSMINGQAGIAGPRFNYDATGLSAPRFNYGASDTARFNVLDGIKSIASKPLPTTTGKGEDLFISSMQNMFFQGAQGNGVNAAQKQNFVDRTKILEGELFAKLTGDKMEAAIIQNRFASINTFLNLASAA